MAFALAEPNGKRGRPSAKEKNETGTNGKWGDTPHFSRDLLQDARTILAHSRETALKLLAGDPNVVWNKALENAKLAKTQEDARAAAIAELEQEFPDLADKVRSDFISLEDAQREAGQRRQRERTVRSNVLSTCRQAISVLQTFATASFAEDALGSRITFNGHDANQKEQALAFRKEVAEAIGLHELTPDRLSVLEIGYDTLIDLIMELRKGAS